MRKRFKPSQRIQPDDSTRKIVHKQSLIDSFIVRETNEDCKTQVKLDIKSEIKSEYAGPSELEKWRSLQVPPIDDAYLFEKLVDCQGKPTAMVVCSSCQREISDHNQICNLNQNTLFCFYCGLKTINDGDEFVVTMNLSDSYLIETKDRKTMDYLDEEQYLSEKSSENEGFEEVIGELQDQRDSQTYPLWNYKEDLQLMEAIEKFGIHSYEAIKEYMRSNRDVQDIEKHLHQLSKLMMQREAEESNGKIDVESTSHQNQVQQPIDSALKTRYQNPTDHQKSQIGFCNKKAQREQALRKRRLKALGYNEKRKEFDSSMPQMFEMLLAECDSEDSKETRDLLMQGYKQQVLVKELAEKKLVSSNLLTKKIGKKNSQNREIISEERQDGNKDIPIENEDSWLSDDSAEERGLEEESQGGENESEQSQQLEIQEFKLKALLFDPESDRDTRLLFSKLQMYGELLEMQTHAQEVIEISKKLHSQAVRSQMDSRDINSFQPPETLLKSIFDPQKLQNIVQAAQTRESHIYAEYSEATDKNHFSQKSNSS